MAKYTEKNLDRILRETVKKIGGWSIKIEPIHISGLPDRLLLLPGGRVVFVEVKTAGKKPTPIQKYVHKRLRKIGFSVYILDKHELINQIIG